MRTSITRALIIRVLLAGTVALAPAGCDRGGPPKAAGASPNADIRTAALQYASCMRERGYEVPDPTFDERGLPHFAGPTRIGKQQDFDADQRACRTALSAAYEAAGIRGKQVPSTEQLVAFTRCVREQGLQIADPSPGGSLELEKATLNSPAWPAAVEACKQHLPPEYVTGLANPTGKR